MNCVNGWRSFLEDRGDRSALVDSVGRKALALVSHGNIGAAGRAPA